MANVSKILYLLMHLMDLVDTLSDDRYWSKVLSCSIPNPIRDFEVKVTEELKHYFIVYG